MKIKINKQGDLELERNGVFKAQCCPKMDYYCGDWGPLFGEPNGCYLSLCDKNLEAFIMIDERKLNGLPN